MHRKVDAATLQRDGGASIPKGMWSVSHAHSTYGVFAFVSHAASATLTKTNLPGVVETLLGEIA